MPALSVENLVGIYRIAAQSDPQIKQAEATMLAGSEAKPQARSLLLPSINASANTTKNDLDVKNGNDSTYTSKGYNVSLTQPLFHFH